METGKSPLPEESGPTFDPSTHWCAKHLEPFRETWGQSADWVMATIGLFTEMTRREEILRACGWRPATETEPEQQADSQMLDRVMREFSPMCCYLGDEVTKRWVDLALRGGDVYKDALKELQTRPIELGG